MKKTYIIEVDIDEAQVERANAKRKAVGSQTYDADTRLEFVLGGALMAHEIFTLRECKPHTTQRLRKPEDPDVNV